MPCEICSKNTEEVDHEISAEHLNKILSQFDSKKKKKFAGNRKGILVQCSVKSSFTPNCDSTKAKVKLSAQPNEEVCFLFSLTNNTKQDTITLKYVKTVYNPHNFKLQENDSFPIMVKPKKKESIISIKFSFGDVGQYELPVIFQFSKSNAPKENIIIVRQLVIFVERHAKVHEKVISPYKEDTVFAKNFIRGVNIRPNGDTFAIPKKYKKLFAMQLKVPGTTEFAEEKEMAMQIKESFDTGVTEDNYVRLFHNLLWYEETIVRINLKKYNMSEVPLTVRGKSYVLNVPGLAEKRPSLMIGDLVLVILHGQDEAMFEAVISNIEDNNAILDKFAEQFSRYHNEESKYDIRFIMSRLPMERMHVAVNTVIKNRQASRIFPSENTRLPIVQPITEFFNPLIMGNLEQRSAVEHIVSGSSGLAPYLLHGPPGTGKTFTIIEAILQLVSKNPAYRILVCTESNMAADHVASLIVDYIHMFSDKLLLRANSKYRDWKSLPEKLVHYSNGSNESFEPVSVNDFKAYNIVVTTLSHAAKYSQELHEKTDSRFVTHLFIDEAAQASEPSSLIPISGMLKSNGMLVLAGDPKQLGPVIISREVQAMHLGTSLMERLMTTYPMYSSRDPNYCTMLINNFRSDMDILQLPNALFYSELLKAYAPLDPLSKIDILNGNNGNCATVFHGVLSKEMRMGKSPSYFNLMELEVVQQYVQALILRCGVRQDEIGIIAPYMRQVYQIKKWLQKKGYTSLEVGSVEAFQGKEKRVIIISTVRAESDLLKHDAKYKLGFLVDDRRFNVAITRAKAKVIIIGNPLCLQKDVKWRQYIRLCQEKGSHRGFETPELCVHEKQKIVTELTPVLEDMKLEDKQENGKK